jgi:transposase-like protein
MRENGRVVSKGMLLVMGINSLERREALTVGVADTENATTWSAIFRDLKERGLPASSW